MHPAGILYPVIAMAALTALVWLVMLVTRARHMQAHGIVPNDMPTRVLADAKFGEAQTPNNNLMNLFELPVLFYVAAVIIFQLRSFDVIYSVLAWTFVLLRCVHSAIHLTYNDVLHRGLAYLLSGSILWLIWLRLAYQVMFGP
ncbi:MAG: hypothetical protein C5B56_02435 [Proteobacteria bacterium]|nr:MAG: hypothetical protein C5B56_02435 [Pseudomonadota bacterium]